MSDDFPPRPLTCPRCRDTAEAHIARPQPLAGRTTNGSPSEQPESAATALMGALIALGLNQAVLSLNHDALCLTFNALSGNRPARPLDRPALRANQRALLADARDVVATE